MKYVLSVAQRFQGYSNASKMRRMPSPAVLFIGFHRQLASVKDDDWGDTSMLQDLNSAHAVSHKPGNGKGEGILSCWMENHGKRTCVKGMHLEKLTRRQVKV